MKKLTVVLLSYQLSINFEGHVWDVSSICFYIFAMMQSSMLDAFAHFWDVSMWKDFCKIVLYNHGVRIWTWPEMVHFAEKLGGRFSAKMVILCVRCQKSTAEFGIDLPEEDSSDKCHAMSWTRSHCRICICCLLATISPREYVAVTWLSERSRDWMASSTTNGVTDNTD